MSPTPTPTSADASEPDLVTKVLATHDALTAAGIGHAFGGALALAYWTEDPRTTADIDINVSVSAAEGARVFAALPAGVTVPTDALGRLDQDEQIRVRWGRTPIDLFFRVISFHDGIAARSVQRSFAGRPLTFVCADDLAVLKALFDRPKDWLDIDAMRRAGSVELSTVIERVAAIVGSTDHRIDRLHDLARA